MTFAVLLIVSFNVNSNSMDVNAIDFGMISKDDNVGSIDTESLFNCFGAAITCDNDNVVNNNVTINDGNNPVEPLTCEECFTNNLTPEQIEMIEELAGPIAAACANHESLTPEQLAALINNTSEDLESLGIDEDSAQVVENCLKEVYGV
jgi:hypothetical protein